MPHWLQYAPLLCSTAIYNTISCILVWCTTMSKSMLKETIVYHSAAFHWGKDHSKLQSLSLKPQLPPQIMARGCNPGGDSVLWLWKVCDFNSCTEQQQANHVMQRLLRWAAANIDLHARKTVRQRTPIGTTEYPVLEKLWVKGTAKGQWIDSKQSADMQLPMIARYVSSNHGLRHYTCSAKTYYLMKGVSRWWFPGLHSQCKHKILAQAMWTRWRFSGLDSECKHMNYCSRGVNRSWFPGLYS